MNLILTITFCLAVGLCSGSLLAEWTSFKKIHGKRYQNKLEEKRRMEIFSSNKEMIEKHNELYKKGLVSYEMELNKFADKSPEEISEMNGMNRTGELLRLRPRLQFYNPGHLKVPSSVDWRKKGAVTPVKDQGQCGGCWAFSAVGSLEGQFFLKSGKLISLSEQNLIDCGEDFMSGGCDGGLMDNGFQEVRDLGGIDTEDSYPYEAENGECRFDRSKSVGTVTDYVDIQKGDEEALMKAVATVGPISIGINAGLKTFAYYKKGVYGDHSCDPNALNHGVLLVGYGSENGQDYWLIKNSWNTNWGEEGYIKIARNQGNMCGVATLASYPIVSVKK